VEAVSRYVVARDGSAALRAGLADLAATVREEVALRSRPSEESLARLRELEREYFRLRAPLFELALLPRARSSWSPSFTMAASSTTGRPDA
jgi:hypothetical protein